MRFIYPVSFTLSLTGLLFLFCLPAHAQSGSLRDSHVTQSSRPAPTPPSPDPWIIRADTIDPSNYYGVTIANGMVGLVSSSAPFKAKNVVLHRAFDLSCQ